MSKQNCWEVLKCGRQPGGDKVKTLGVCPAASAQLLDGTNSGKNGGRCCWAVAGTFCEGTSEGVLARKLVSCLDCAFFRKVVQEEGWDLKTTKDILCKLKETPEISRQCLHKESK